MRLMDSRLDRRSVLRGALLAGGAAVAGPSLAGCGSPVSLAAAGSAVPPTLVPFTGVTPAFAGTSQGVPDAFVDYPADPVTAVSSVPGDGSSVSAAVFTYSPVPPGVGSNSFWQAVNTRLGIDLRLQITPASDYQSKFSTTIAGGQLPDLMQLGSSPLMPLLLQTKCVDLSDQLSGDAAERYPHLAGLGPDAWRAGMFNGRIYGLPSPRGTMGANVLYRRDDLLAAKGITDEPTDSTSLLGMFQEMTNARSGRWALTGVPFTSLGPMTGVPNTWRLESDGSLVSQWEGEEQEQCIELGRKLLAAGVVHPDWASSSSQKQWLGSGTCTFHEDSYSAWQQFYRENTAGASFDLGGVLLPKADGGGLASPWRGNPAFVTSVITKGNEHRVDMLLKVLDYLAAPFGTQEYLFLKFGLAGDDYTLQGSNPQLSSAGAAQTALGLSYLVDAPRVIYTPGNETAVRKQYEHLHTVVPVAARNPVLYLYSEADSRYGPRLNTQIVNARNDAVTGRVTMRSWRQSVADWRAGGGDTTRKQLMAALEATPASQRPPT